MSRKHPHRAARNENGKHRASTGGYRPRLWHRWYVVNFSFISRNESNLGMQNASHRDAETLTVWIHFIITRNPIFRLTNARRRRSSNQGVYVRADMSVRAGRVSMWVGYLVVQVYIFCVNGRWVQDRGRNIHLLVS